MKNNIIFKAGSSCFLAIWKHCVTKGYKQNTTFCKLLDLKPLMHIISESPRGEKNILHIGI